MRSWCRREKRNSWRSRDRLGLEGRKELSREEKQDQALLTVGSGWSLWLCLTHFSAEW